MILSSMEGMNLVKKNNASERLAPLGLFHMEGDLAEQVQADQVLHIASLR